MLATGAATADSALSGVSGKVVDMEGTPVADFIFAVKPVQRHNGILRPDHENPAHLFGGKSDAAGDFTLTDITPGPVQFAAMSESALTLVETFDPEDPPTEMPHLHRGGMESDKKIFSVQIGKVTAFNIGERSFATGPTITLESGRTLENILITVKDKLRIPGQIVYADGTPLVNAQGRLRTEQREELTVNSRASSNTNFFTDAEGYFTEYPDRPGFYMVSIEYHGLTAGAGPFLIKDGEHPELVVFTLDGTSEDVNPKADVPPEPGGSTHYRPAPSEGVWVINPINGHAYKRVPCESWEDAQRTAVAEGSHLVSINDEAEQHWIEAIFGRQPFWLGLTDTETEGEWEWDSGEPVTFTNWAVQPVFPDRLPDAEKDYVVFTFRNGMWQSVGPESPFWGMARHAVIEKDGLISQIRE